MAAFDPFEKEFRRQAQGLRRSPSPRAWNRLERRLDHRGGGRILGIRPWMIAALFLLAAGISVITRLSDTRQSILAQQAEVVEELTTPYTPMENFTPVVHENGVPSVDTETYELGHDFRDVVVAEKYRG